ncbi:MAG: O-antigen ligase family protein [Anaerolineae bacterium]|nr:O-antigen ligase family protein [Anaerolineae bacterium]
MRKVRGGPTPRSIMKYQHLYIFIFGLLLLLVAVVAGIQVEARQRFLMRGWETVLATLVADTGQPRACVNAALEQYDAVQLSWALDMMAEGGFAWVRQRFSWAEIEPEPGVFRWEPWDMLVAESAARDLTLIAVLDDAPGWATVPPSAEAFATFARAFAARYGDTITYYQIWHNPNLGDAWGGYANAYSYTELLSRAAVAIREADSGARIVLGSLAPTVETGERNYAEDLFLEMLYAAGAEPYFDVVAMQPYGFFSEPEDRRVDREVLNFSRVILAREVLVAHGEAHKAIWISHLGWNSKPADWPGPVSIWGNVDMATQAEYTLAAFKRAEREWPWLGTMCLNGFQPRPESVSDTTRAVPNAEGHWGFALVGPDGEPRPVYDAISEWAIRERVATPGTYVASTDLATFEGTWILGPQGADIGQSGDRVQLAFEGTDIALTVRRGPYRAFLFVTVDGEPAPALPRDENGKAYVVLYDPLAAVATVPLAENLPPGRHIVEVTAERGWGQWALVGWRVAHRPDVTAYRTSLGLCAVLSGAGLILAVWAGLRVDWGTIGYKARRLRARVKDWVRIVLTLLLSILYIFAAWQTMMNDAFRRLGQGGEMVTLLLATGAFYFSPWLVLTLAAGICVSLIVFLDPALGLMVTILAVPFYMHPLSLLGKSFALAELVLLPTAVGWIVWWVRKWGEARGEKKDARITSYELRITDRVSRFTFYAAGALILVSLLSTLFAVHTREAVRELRLVVLEPVVFYVMLVTLPMDRQARWRVIDAFVVSGVLVAVLGLFQYGASFCRGTGICDQIAYALGEVITAEGGMRRLHSIYGSPNNVGLYLGRVFPLLIAVALWGEERREKREEGREKSFYQFTNSLFHSRRRLLYAVAACPVALALLLSFSKGAIVIGIPAAIIVMGFLAGPGWRKATLVVIVLGLIALIPLLQTPRFAGMFDFTSGTTGFRVALWRSSWAMFRDHPLLGVGLDNFLYAYRTRYVLPTAWEEFNLAHPHNIVADFASRLGILGIGVLLVLQAVFWRLVSPLRKFPDAMTRALALGIIGSMVDFLGHGLVDASYFVIDLAYVYFLSLAVAVWLNEDTMYREK